MGAIKALVVGLGIVIVVMIGLVIWGLMRQGESLRQKQGLAFEDLSLPVPAGCSLAAVEPGEGGRLLLRLDGPLERGCQQAILVEAGRVAGRVVLQAE